MVADNKNSVSNEVGTATVAKVGDGGQTANGRKLWSKRPTKKKVFVLLLLILIIIAAVLVVNYETKPGQKVYAEAAGHKIYKKDIQDVRGNNTTISDHDAAVVLADKYLSRAMAQEKHVSISQADLSAASCPDQKTNPYGYQTCANQVYFAKLSNNNAGVYQGKYLMASFSRYVPYQSSLLAQQEQLEPKIGNAAAIAADKAYAQTLITDLYDQIKANKISFDQAIQMEQNDPVVGEHGTVYQNQPHSGDFNGPLNQYNAFAAPGLQKRVADIKPGTTTKPFVVRVADSAKNPNSTAESYFLAVRMDKASGGNNDGLSFPQELAKAKRQLGYQVNV